MKDYYNESRIEMEIIKLLDRGIPALTEYVVAIEGKLDAAENKIYEIEEHHKFVYKRIRPLVKQHIRKARKSAIDEVLEILGGMISVAEKRAEKSSSLGSMCAGMEIHTLKDAVEKIKHLKRGVGK